MLPPTILLYSVLARPIRAVGPVVLAFLLIAVSGANAALEAFAPLLSSERLSDSASDMLFWLISAGGFVTAGVCAQLALQFFRRRYERKQSSDIILTLDCMWLIFVLFQSAVRTNLRGLSTLTPLLAFITYKLVSSYFLRPLYRTVAAGPGRGLLLLRVFGHRRRTRRMLDVLGARWRYLGSIQLIAGTDVAADYLGVPQFLDYIRRRLSGYFIRSDEDLRRRIADLDTSPDADGRFRVNMFFCFDNTWRMTVAELIRKSDAVLMDLRGFSAAHRGCAEELHSVLRTAPDRVLLLIDPGTDQTHLRHALAAAWPSPAGSVREITALMAGATGATVAAAISLLDSLTADARRSATHSQETAAG